MSPVAVLPAADMDIALSTDSAIMSEVAVAAPTLMAICKAVERDTVEVVVAPPALEDILRKTFNVVSPVAVAAVAAAEIDRRTSISTASLVDVLAVIDISICSAVLSDMSGVAVPAETEALTSLRIFSSGSPVVLVAGAAMEMLRKTANAADDVAVDPAADMDNSFAISTVTSLAVWVAAEELSPISRSIASAADAVADDPALLIARALRTSRETDDVPVVAAADIDSSNATDNITESFVWVPPEEDSPSSLRTSMATISGVADWALTLNVPSGRSMLTMIPGVADTADGDMESWCVVPAFFRYNNSRVI